MAENKENPKSELAQNEEKVLEFWKQNNIFQKTLDKSSTKGEFVFYEGPPTANAKPALHHLEARAFKDVIPRYKTMQGFHVRRKAGWDTHGLPVELQIEKKLGLKSKKEIETYGIAKFNKECKESVHEYIDLWKTFTERMGYWVDFDGAYYTYDSNYIESLWNVVGEINKRGLLYKDYKVVPWCPRCGTVLSSHELAQGYQDDKDLSAYVKFKIVGQDNIYILAWTTTPWTLPGNVGLAVGRDIDYVKVKIGGEILIIAKSRVSLFEGEYEIIEDLKGSDLAGLSYEPLYPYLPELISGAEKEKMQNAYKVYTADFVTTTDGTGIVHTAVMYGIEDFELGTKVGLPKFHLVDEAGNFIKGMGFLEGRFVKEADENGKPTLAVDIIEDLKKRGLFFKQENIKHSYPHCWRCKTALIYYARDSWYVSMSKLRNELAAENEKINWEPAHIKEGRFGEWIREVKDWAISRERYWGTPLPIWVAEDGEKIIVDSYEALKKHSKKNNNKYLVMRHGEAENNILNIISCKDESIHHLTEKGREQVRASAEKLKDAKIDLIFVSPFLRTRETAEIIQNILGLSPEAVIFDPRLHEISCGDFDGKSVDEYHEFFLSKEERFSCSPLGGENYIDIKKRLGGFIFDIENKYSGKNILILTHDAPAWLLFSAVYGFDAKKTLELHNQGLYFFENAEIKILDFNRIPLNENFELDPHKPYIDEIVLEKDGKEFRRTKEVMDVWFDSGSMPFAQDHYPFENKDWVLGAGYPADFISEAIDQTRGWFYTLLAVGVLMNRGTPYKNVICLGHLLDAQGKKMSKSIGNIVEPFEQMNKFGADAVRFWMYSVNQPGESKNYDEKTVAEINNKVFNLIYNVLSFYELYRDSALEQGLYNGLPANILDQWIVSRLNQLVKSATENLDNFKLLEPARAIKDFIGDFSTWYLRRSRERIKEGDGEAKRTLYFVLKNLAKIMAPFTPFTAEDIWLKLRVEQNKESIHLTNWPALGEVDFDLLLNMEQVRKIVSSGLEARQKAGIKVRQPLAKLSVKSFQLSDEYTELIKDELNVKEIIFDAGKRSDLEEAGVELDTNITPELKQEGDYRELLRFIQDMRKKGELMPSNQIVLEVETDTAGQDLINKFKADLKKSAQVKEIEFKSNAGAEAKIDNFSFKIEIKK